MDDYCIHISNCSRKIILALLSTRIALPKGTVSEYRDKFISLCIISKLSLLRIFRNTSREMLCLHQFKQEPSRRGRISDAVLFIERP